ncbi:MAG: hypothetical protein ASARMPREDX12_000196 [Alectoria sarmentosa]|nr:MAG: hypothetical protein ASARMPREDX12_000196 [Alectoria sarmentosa]
MLLPTPQSPQDQKKTRNRLAQRKHRQRIRNDSILGTTREGVGTRDRVQSFSLPNSPWEAPWVNLAQSQSARAGVEDQNECKDQFSNNSIRTGEHSFFPNTGMDCTGIMIPGLDLPQLITLEEEWPSVPDSQHEFLSRQFSHNQKNGEICSTHFPSPVHSEQNPGFQHRRSHERHDNESRQPIEAEGMQVGIPKMSPGFTRKDSSASSTASNESQQSAPIDPGSEFERILDVVEEAGFDSIDMMAAQYYSAKFKPNSTSQRAQANSRSRDLRRLLQALHKTAKQWSKQETQAYEEEIVRSAKSICLEELRLFRERQADCPRRPSISRTESALGSSSSTSMTGQNRSSAGTVDQLRQLLLQEESSQPTQQEKRLLRQCLPETWSLLSELARSPDLPPAQVSQAVYDFLHVTTANMTR